jgi:hypothetical protein
MYAGPCRAAEKAIQWIFFPIKIKKKTSPRNEATGTELVQTNLKKINY